MRSTQLHLAGLAIALSTGWKRDPEGRFGAIARKCRAEASLEPGFFDDRADQTVRGQDQRDDEAIGCDPRHSP